MGYTHYWYAKAKTELPNWEQFTEKVNLIVGNDGAGVLPSALQKAEVTDAHVWIEGNPSHESFVFEKVPKNMPWRENEPWVFNFCKTARKPYDTYVTATLIAALDHWGSDVVKVSSDGSIQEWEEGIEHYMDCLTNKEGFTDKAEWLRLNGLIEKSFNKDD